MDIHNKTLLTTGDRNMSKKQARRSVGNKKITCFKCEKVLKEEYDDFIQCDKCGKNFHSLCSGLTRREFDRLVDNESEQFSCHYCSDENEDLKQQLKNINSELKKLEKLDKLEQLAESINFMSAKFDEVIKDVEQNKKKIHVIEKENKKLRNEVETLKSAVTVLNNNRVKNDCIISGLKVESGAKAVEAVMNLSKNVGVDLDVNSVEDAYFIKSKQQNDKQSVVVKFASKQQKDKLMGAKPKLKATESLKMVYINDFHSKETLNLLYHARSLKSIGYRYVYANNGRVFCKKSDISKQILIRCGEDVDNLLLNATTNKHWPRRSMVQNRECNEEVDLDDDEDGACYVSP